MSLKVGELFAGYGGLGMGVTDVLDAEVAWVSEIDKGACKVLAHHFPDVPNIGDITAVDWSQVEPVDVLTGGFPCQDVSSAGKRAGIRPGTRSGLWEHFAHAISQLRPSLVVIENVRGLLSATAHSDVEPCAWCLGDDTDGALRALGAVLGDLADLGYDASWYGLRAADVGAPHSRFRVFVIATNPERPLHGRDYGWRGVHTDRSPEARDVLGAGRVDDVLQGAGHAESSASHLRREPHHAEAGQQVGDSGRMLVLEDYERKVRRLLAANAASPGGEAGACGLGDPVSRDSEAAPAWTGAGGAVVGLAAPAGRGGMASHEGAEPDGAGELLPSPSAADGNGGGRYNSDGHQSTLPGTVRELLLPSPRTSDTNGAGQHGDGGLDLRTAVSLLPTPAVNDMGEGKTPEAWDAWTDAMKAKHGNGNGHGASLAIEAQRLLPTPTSADHKASGAAGYGGNEFCTLTDVMVRGRGYMDRPHDTQQWGQYAAAIARWEQITRPAPPPTETGPKGNPRLSAKFSEWLMGVPDGWITDVPGVTRNEALRMAGNGVVPQQAAAALRFLLALERVA